jgi:hypothetical protein
MTRHYQNCGVAITPFGPASLGLDHVNAAPREVDRKRQADGPAPTIKTRVSNKIRHINGSSKLRNPSWKSRAGQRDDACASYDGRTQIT